VLMVSASLLTHLSVPHNKSCETEVLMAMSMKVDILWDVALCSLVDVDQGGGSKLL
jgi:hypothetical protein